MKKVRQFIKGTALILFWAFLMAMGVRNIKAVSIVSRCKDSIDVYNKLAVCADKCGLDDSCAYYIRKVNYWIDSANRTLRRKTPKTRRSFKELRKKYGGGCHCDVPIHVVFAGKSPVVFEDRASGCCHMGVGYLESEFDQNNHCCGCVHCVQEIPHAFLFSDLSAGSTSYLDPQSSICKICPVDTSYRDYLNGTPITTGLEWTTNQPSYSYFDNFNLVKWPLPPLTDSLFPVWLLVTDTSHLIYHHTADPQGNKIDQDVDVGVNNWGAFMIPGYSVLRKKWDRWGEQEYWEPTGYLDDKKRPLSGNYIVWMEIARK